MEKRRSHYRLDHVKDLMRLGRYRITASARQCAARDFRISDDHPIVECILSLKSDDFYKSMTALHDSRLWHDVYRPTVSGIPAYVKVQIVENATVVISFKALEDR